MLNQTPLISASAQHTALPSNSQNGSTTDSFSATLAKHIQDNAAQKTADTPKDATKNSTASKDSTKNSSATKNSPASKDSKNSKKTEHTKTVPPDTSLATITALPVNAALTPLKVTVSESNLKGGSAGLSAAAHAKADNAKLAANAQLKGKTAPLAADNKPWTGAVTKTTRVSTAKTNSSILDIKITPKSPSTAELPAPGMMPSTQLPQSGLPSSTPTGTLATPLNHSAWPTEFSQKINWMTNKQIQIAELHINPPDLGPMSVVLTIKDNQATALFTSQHSAVRDAIQNALPQLRDSMADNGIMLGNATVSDHPARDNNNNNFLNQHANQGEQRGEGDAVASISTTTIRQQNGLVDTFA
ncbi:MAG: flagellar hook-length control protein FliK [Gallionella sp.]